MPKKLHATEDTGHAMNNPEQFLQPAESATSGYFRKTCPLTGRVRHLAERQHDGLIYVFEYTTDSVPHVWSSPMPDIVKEACDADTTG